MVTLYGRMSFQLRIEHVGTLGNEHMVLTNHYSGFTTLSAFYMQLVGLGRLHGLVRFCTLLSDIGNECIISISEY